MIVKTLRSLGRKVITNVHNENVRQVVIPLLTTVLQNPDDLVAEISINALNDRDKRGGPVSEQYEANAALITQIGGAHLAGLENVDDPVMFLAERKARIFRKLKENGVAILNYDMEPRVYKYVKEVAMKHTSNIFSYSFSDQHADAFVKKIENFRDYSTVTVMVLGEEEIINISMPGEGVVMDLLGACLLIRSLGMHLPDMHKLFMNFEALNSELKFIKIDGKMANLQ